MVNEIRYANGIYNYITDENNKETVFHFGIPKYYNIPVFEKLLMWKCDDKWSVTYTKTPHCFDFCITKLEVTA